MYDKLLTKDSAFDTKIPGIKTQYDSNKQDLEKRNDDTEKNILITSGMVKRTC